MEYTKEKYKDHELLQTYTFDQLLIIGSLLEKEGIDNFDKKLIFSVIQNRLQKKMKLQIDATTIFAITDGSYDLGRDLNRKDLKIKHPYNTYRRHGLPPGPICNPGRESITAVLNPEETSALFFVADGTGGHIFSDTLKAHLKAVRKWRKIERSIRRRAKQVK